MSFQAIVRETGGLRQVILRLLVTAGLFGAALLYAMIGSGFLILMAVGSYSLMRVMLCLVSFALFVVSLRLAVNVSRYGIQNQLQPSIGLIAVAVSSWLLLKWVKPI